MINLDKFIDEHVTGRSNSMFAADIEANSRTLTAEIEGKKVLVIGGAGSIGSSFIKALLPFGPEELVVADLSENGLAELTRDLRSTYSLRIPEKYRTYAIDFANPILSRIMAEAGGFDIVANFSAHKHVRSEKDRFSVEAMLENNLIKARGLLQLLTTYPPRHFFCVSTDKAADPVNIMGASKRVMEDLIMAYSPHFKVTTARFANVAFSNGSLLAGFVERFMKHQPLAAPADVRRYFVSPRESGEICLLACILGHSGEIFFPKLRPTSMLTFSTICDRWLESLGYEKVECASDEEARRMAATMRPDSRQYPVVYFKSDTTGEKDFEEFYVEGESIDTSRFEALGVITGSPRRSAADVEHLLNCLTARFADPKFTKAEIVDILSEYLPNFHHEEKGRNLDQKM